MSAPTRIATRTILAALALSAAAASAPAQSPAPTAGYEAASSGTPYAGHIEVPALVIHGTDDRIIPAAHGRQLAEALGSSTWLAIEGAGHNDLLGFSEVWHEIGAFVTDLRQSSPL